MMPLPCADLKSPDDLSRHAARRHHAQRLHALRRPGSPNPRASLGHARDPHRIYDFCAAIVDATADMVCAFKPQIAYFAAHGAEDQLERLMQHMRCNAPHVPVILDAKRGDIGSTAQQYAREAFERYGADAVTLSPFMGWDSVQPHLEYHGKGLSCCAAPPTPAATTCGHNAWPACQPALVYEHIAALAQGPWNKNGQLGLVVAPPTRTIERVRALAHAAALIPGVGARATTPWPRCAPGCARRGPSSSTPRAPSSMPRRVPDFAQAARQAAQHTRDTLNAARA